MSGCVASRRRVPLVADACLVPTTITTIKTLYVFVEIAIDSHHLLQTVRLNFPTDRDQFHETLLDGEETISKIPAGLPIGPGQHLRIEGPSSKPECDRSSAKQSQSGSSGEPTRLALVSTIQFVAALAQLKEDLSTELVNSNEHAIQETGLTDGDHGELEIAGPKLHEGKYETIIPRSKPLSPGEILGCTSPHLSDDVDAIL